MHYLTQEIKQKYNIIHLLLRLCLLNCYHRWSKFLACIYFLFECIRNPPKKMSQDLIALSKSKFSTKVITFTPIYLSRKIEISTLKSELGFSLIKMFNYLNFALKINNYN